MNIVELYEGTPVQAHGNIRVCDDRVFVKDSQGSIEEYLLGDDGELWRLPSPLAEVAAKISKIEKDLFEIKAKLSLG